MSDPATDLAIDVSNTQSHLKADPDALVRIARAVLQGEGVRHAALSIAIVDNPTIRQINRLYLEHDWATDVVTFPLSESGEHVLAGEVVVSAQMALETAAPAGADPQLELTLYLVHGLLHLCGYDDTTDAQRARMRHREAEVMAALGLPNAFLLPPAVAPETPCSGREVDSCSA